MALDTLPLRERRGEVVMALDSLPLLENVEKGRDGHCPRHLPSSGKRKGHHDQTPLRSSGSNGGVAIVIDIFLLLEKEGVAMTTQPSFC